MIDQTAVQQSNTAASPDTWITLKVTFRESEWAALVQVSKTVNDVLQPPDQIAVDCREN